MHCYIKWKEILHKLNLSHRVMENIFEISDTAIHIGVVYKLSNQDSWKKIDVPVKLSRLFVSSCSHLASFFLCSLFKRLSLAIRVLDLLQRCFNTFNTRLLSRLKGFWNVYGEVWDEWQRTIVHKRAELVVKLCLWTRNSIVVALHLLLHKNNKYGLYIFTS